MKREQKDGLLMDNSIYMFDEKKPGFPIYSRIIQFVAILIGSWGSIGLLMEALAVPADYLKVNLVILLCTGILFTLCILPSMDLVKLFFGILFYGLIFYSRLPKLQNGFYILENLVLDRVSAYYEFNTIRFLADYTNALYDITLLMIMIIIPVVAMLAVAVIRNRLVSIVGILLFLPVIICFAFGLIPSERYLIAYLIAVLYMSRSSFHSRKFSNRDQKLLLHRINSGAAIWLSMISLTIFFLIKLFVSEDKYASIPEIKETKQELQNAMFNFTWEDFTGAFSDIYLFPNQRAVGGLSGGQLGKVGKVEYTESEQLRITAPKSEVSQGVYLKGYVGSVYTGSKWDEHTEEVRKDYKRLTENFTDKQFNPVNLLELFIDYNIRYAYLDQSRSNNVMSVEYEHANKDYIYLPYVTNYPELENINYVQDLYAAPKKKKKNYTVNFDGSIFNSFSFQTLFNYVVLSGQSFHLGDNSENERLYQEFVHDAYTQLPEEGVEKLINEFSQVQVDTSIRLESIVDPFTKQKLPFQNINYNREYAYQISKIQYVLDYLNSNTSYSLSPGKLPSGKDFVEYFLYESKKGYCSHYASAATLMLRAMNVPARYVEGYAVTPMDIEQNIISTSKAETEEKTSKESSFNSSNSYINATFQVVTDNTVIEFSVKDYNAHAWVEVYFDGIGWIPVDFTPSSSIGSLSLGQNSDDSSDVKPTRAPNTQSQEPTPTKRPTPIPKNPNTNDADKDASNSAKVSAADKKKLDNLFLQAFLLLILVGAAGAIIYLKIKHKNNKKNENHNREAIVLFMKIEKILAVCKELGKRGARLEDLEDDIKEHCSYMDPDAFASCMEIVRKARFGKGKITQEELNQVEILYYNLFEKACREQAFLKKVYLRFIFSLSFT